MVSSGTGFSPSVFDWINFVHDACYENEELNINYGPKLQIWIPSAINNKDYDWSVLNNVSSVKLPNVTEFSNVEVKIILEIIAKMPELVSLNLSGKYYYFIK